MPLDHMHRAEIVQFIRTADFCAAVAMLRDLLKRQLIGVLGGDWDQIHNKYGMYTITCRMKRERRTIEKCETLADAGEVLSRDTFVRRIPDLAAGRLVVVDPDDMFVLAERVRNYCVPPLFLPPDSPLRRSIVRHGRFSMYDVGRLRDANYEIREEPTGYCSIHFVFRTGRAFFESKCHDEELVALRRLDQDGLVPLDAWHVEVQVRTLMEEAWGETDHYVRYEDPALRNDPDIQGQFAALAAYLQAANHHVTVIRNAARRRAHAL